MFYWSAHKCDFTREREREVVVEVSEQLSLCSLLHLSLRFSIRFLLLLYYSALLCTVSGSSNPISCWIFFCNFFFFLIRYLFHALCIVTALLFYLSVALWSFSRAIGSVSEYSARLSPCAFSSSPVAEANQPIVQRHQTKNKRIHRRRETEGRQDVLVFSHLKKKKWELCLHAFCWLASAGGCAGGLKRTHTHRHRHTYLLLPRRLDNVCFYFQRFRQTSQAVLHLYDLRAHIQLQNCISAPSSSSCYYYS